MNIQILFNHWPPVKTKRRLIYLISCMLFGLLATLACVINGADCLTSSSIGNSSPSSSGISVVKSVTTNTQGIYRKSKDGWREIYENQTVHVKENTPIGTKLTDIKPDTLANNVIYEIVWGSDQSAFTLRLDNNLRIAELVNNVDLDYESPKKSYNVVVRATTAHLKYDVDIEIIVTDENDNKPILEDFAIVFNHYKNHFPSAPIGRVPASDADVNDQLHYRVLAGNNAQLVVVNETTGDIHLSPWLNSNVPMKAVIVVAVSDGLNEAVAQLVLYVNLVTEVMLQNSVVLQLNGIGREEFLTKKYDLFINKMAMLLGPNNLYGPNNIVVFDVEESIVNQESTIHQDPSYSYRSYHSSLANSTLSINVSFSARADGNDVESYLSSQFIEERIYLNRMDLMQFLGVHIAPFQDNLCVQEPCSNYQECQATYKFDRAPKTFLTTQNMIFRPIKAVQSYTCNCPPTFTGMKQKIECNLQIDQCFSNPCLNDGICHRHESGYSCECPWKFIGHRCEHNFVNSTCQSITTTTPAHILSEIAQPTRQATMCSGKSRCVDLNRPHFQTGKSELLATTTNSKGGFSCQNCPNPQWSTDLCQLRARSFSKNTYITLPALRRRHRFHIMLQFATVQNDALLLYNGRYNDKHDFIALEIADSSLKFSSSLGTTVTTVSLSSVSVSDGNWHKVAIDFKDRNVTLLVDDCDPVIDEALARIQGSSMKRCSNTTYAEPTTNSDSLLKEFKSLDLTSPMQIGALPPLLTEFQISAQNTFIGCISDIYIDHQLVDLSSPIQDTGTRPGCSERRNFCQQHSCNGYPCQDSWNAPKCSCAEEYLGKSCEILISNEKVRKFNGNSYLSYNLIDSIIPPNWQASLYFRSINPNGVLLKISLETDSTIQLELANGGLKLSYRARNMTFNKINLDDGEWHFVELIWSNDNTQLQIDHNPNLAIQSPEFGSLTGAILKLVTVGAAPTRPNSLSDTPISEVPIDSRDFSSVSNVPQDNFANIYSFGGNSSQSFVGCIYGLNISDNSELWLAPSDERNVDRGCQIVDPCETNSCPINSHCIRKGMSQRKCICNPGFVGDKCLPICDLTPCQGENSKCIPIISPIHPVDNLAGTLEASSMSSNPVYKCECEPHRSGKNCEHQLSPRCPSNWWGRPVAGSNSSICGPCNCDETKGFDGDCDKTTGQCFCKTNHYQPIGSEYCLPCDCYISGSLSASCNQTTGQCKCRPGVVGRRCDSCASSYAEVTLRGCEVIYDACPKTFSDSVWWEKTQPDKLATQQCPPSTSTGTASRFCHKTEGWQKSNMFDCVSNSFSDLLIQFQFFEQNNTPLTTSLAMKIANNLKIALNETVSNPATQLYGSDIYISFRLIHHLIQHESHQAGLNLTHRQDRMYIRNIAESINYILDPAYADNWVEIAARSPDGGAEHLLKLVDTYGKILIEYQADTFTQPFEVSTKYFTIGMDTLSTDQLWDMSKSSNFNNQPPYATDPFGSITPTLDQAGTSNRLDLSSQFNPDGSSIYLDYSSSRDASPAISIPKYDNYQSDVSSNSEDSTKAIIPLKTLRIKTIQELMPSPYYQTRSRAKRDELIIPDFRFTRQQPALVVYSIYRSLGPLLPSNFDNTVQNRLGMSTSVNSPIVWLTVRPANSTEFLNKSIQPKIHYMLKVSGSSGKTRPQCAIWDFLPQSSSANKNQTSYGVKQTGKFTTKGCEIRGVLPNHRLRYKYDYVNCSCDHLGAVAILMDNANYDYLVDEEANVKDISMMIGLGVSLTILIGTLFVLSCIRGHSIKSNSNSINKNLIFILIAIELLILFSTVSRNALTQREYQCKLVAIFLHYFSISLFSWLLVNAIHFYRMLTELRDINHGPMKFYHVLGYAAPAFFVSVAVGLRIEDFGNYLFCWLSIREPIIWSMFGPISFISSIIIILFLLALSKSLPVKEEMSGSDLLKNHMLINIIKTPMIGIYWIITVYVVNEALLDYVFLFPVLAVIKSIALLVLLCVVDKHIRYNLYVSWLRFKGEKASFIEDPLNYSSNQWIPAMMEPGAATFNKQQGYAHTGYTGHITTPGFQSSCTDIFRPDVLAFSAASTTSRSTATGTSSSAAYQYQQHQRVTREAGRDDSYDRARRSRHRRRHKKSHHKHHHHKHHHHHHHHRSHRHHEDDYEHYSNNRRRYDTTTQNQSSLRDNSNPQNDLASSHSSDGDDVSTLPKKTYQSSSNIQQQSSSNSSNQQVDSQIQNQQQEPRDTNNSATIVDNNEQQQTVPMELNDGAPLLGGTPSANNHTVEDRIDQTNQSIA